MEDGGRKTLRGLKQLMRLVTSSIPACCHGLPPRSLSPVLYVVATLINDKQRCLSFACHVAVSLFPRPSWWYILVHGHGHGVVVHCRGGMLVPRSGGPLLSRKDDDCHGHLKQRPQVRRKMLGKAVERAEGVEVRAVAHGEDWTMMMGMRTGLLTLTALSHIRPSYLSEAPTLKASCTATPVKWVTTSAVAIEVVVVVRGQSHLC